MKNFVPIIFLLLLGVTAHAQDERLRLGAKVGINIATISDDPTIVDSDAGVGTEVGIFGRIGEGFYVQPGLDYVSNKVTLQRLAQPRPGENDAVSIRYIRVPVLVGLETDYEGGGISHLRFMAGPAFNYAVGVGDNNLDVRRRDVRKAQFSLSGGLGIDLFHILELGVMYHHGISTVFNNSGADGKYRNFSLTLGFSI
jgi:hypothetical protein